MHDNDKDTAPVGKVEKLIERLDVLHAKATETPIALGGAIQRHQDAEQQFLSECLEAWPTLRAVLTAGKAAEPFDVPDEVQRIAGDALKRAVARKAAEMGEEPAAIVFWYRNYRGEERYRRVRPISIRYGTSDWHKEPQWLLLADDPENDKRREFAMRDISGVIGSPVLVIRDAAQTARKAAGVGEEIVTDEMIAAGAQAIDDYYNGTKDAPFEGSVEACYRAMRLALHPSQPEGAQSSGGSNNCEQDEGA